LNPAASCEYGKLTVGPDLINFCVRDDIPFTVFEDWSQIKAKVQEVV
jgi:2-hydroxy-3-keto-5-methylthiopentenyl-1-phosphate phosphatase